MNPAFSFVFLLAILLFSIQCSRKGPHQELSPAAKKGTTKSGTNTGTEDAGQKIAYSDVQPIFLKRCGRCHNQNGLANWGDEKVAITNAKKLIQRVAVATNMPPAGSPEASAITTAEKEMIHKWASGIADAASENATPSPSDSGPTGPTTTADQSGADATGNEGHGGPPGPGTEVTVASPAPPPAAPPTSPAPSGTNLALEKCAACHGEKGLSSASGFPHLAGQSATYLNEQLNHFREDKRKDSTSGAMNMIAGSLSKEEQEILVSYFSDLPHPVTAPLSAEKIENLDLGVLFKKGQELAKSMSCNGCHASGPNLLPGPSAWPSLAGQDRVYIENQLAAFLSGKRTNATTMPKLLKQRNPPITDEEMQALGVYFQNLRPEKTESKQ
ncbi:MAG: c-type cytochrome [Bdellovibrionales bacterium]|nr:c-type cytochrome [Bdellovibrionales bacterium]